MVRRRARVFASALALASSLAVEARAQSTDECATAYERAQRLRRDGALREALSQAIVCASASCPTELRQDCTAWIDPIRRGIPSISVRVLGKDGCDVVNASVSLDGERVSDVADGRAVEVDPGVHVLRVEPPGSAPVEQRVVLAQGDRDRAITIRLGPANAVCGAPEDVARPAPAPARPAPAPRPIPVLSLVLGGVGIASLGVSAGFGVAAFDDKSALDACRPTCGHDESDAMRTKFLVADVAGAVGLVALAAAVVLYVTRPGPAPAAYSPR